MNGIFHVIDRSTWPREPWYAYFTAKVNFRLNITTPVDITELVAWRKAHGRKFFPVLLWCMMKAVNAHPEFRMAVNETGQLGYWDVVHPCFTVFHEDDHTFSDTWSEWSADLSIFYERVLADIAACQEVRGVVKAKPDQPKNFCSVSVVPWLAFSSFSEDSWQVPRMLIPLIRFGKYEETAGRIKIPLCVIVPHAVADGWHIAQLVESFQKATRELAAS